MKTILRIALFFIVFLSLSTFAATEVGSVAYSRGVLTGQIGNQPPRILGKGSALYNGETLNTGSSGFALIKLKDGTRMTLRPKTSFRIVNVDTRKGQENAFMRLLRGGLRAITGFISKRSPHAFRVGTAVATIGIRGTEFDARLCEGNECEAENEATGKKPQHESKVVGRVALLRGKGSATGNDNKTRYLTTGAAVYQLDTLETGINSFAVIAFTDKSRVTMSPATVFKVEEYRFKPAKPKENNGFMRFIRGGLRLVTGLIGKLNRSSYRVATPTATIGIRGTGFDLACGERCVEKTASFNPQRNTVAGNLLNYFLRPALALGGNGMYVRVWHGAIELQYSGGKLILPNGQSAYLANGYSKPQFIPAFPSYLRDMGGAPRPDRVQLPKDLFSTSSEKKILPGLYVNVRHGDVVVKDLKGNTVHLGAGEAALASLSGKTVRLKFVPPFQKFDSAPLPDRVTPRMKKMLKLLGKIDKARQKFECRLQ